jgi:hypothetical protein
VIGFPLRHHLTRRSRRGCRRLARLGLSDGGGILLGEVTRLPGLLYPVWGADHYLDPPWDIRPLVENLLAAARDVPPAAVPVTEGRPGRPACAAGKEGAR